MEELQKLVVQWATQKGLLDNVTPERIEAQTLKVLEEIGETAGAFLKGNREDLIDGIGDIAVTIIILAAMKGKSINNKFITKLNHDYSLFEITQGILIDREYNGFHPAINSSFAALKLFAAKQNLYLDHCLESAYQVISKRTGKMVGDTFVKD